MMISTCNDVLAFEDSILFVTSDARERDRRFSHMLNSAGPSQDGKSMLMLSLTFILSLPRVVGLPYRPDRPNTTLQHPRSHNSSISLPELT